MKVIDTDILIDHFHGNQNARDYLAETLASGEELAISVVTLTEFAAGMRAGEEEKTERLLALFTLLNVEPRIARKAGEYLRVFRASHRLEIADGLIAATAWSHGAELATRNIKHYPMTDVNVIVPYERGVTK